jgi:hypothetical protein
MMRDSAGATVWRKNFYERIVRDEAALFNIRRYIKRHPAMKVDQPA